MARSSPKQIMDTNTVTPSRLALAVDHAIKRQRPLMIWGAPGIGKSEIVAQVAQEQGRPLIDIRLPLMEPTDIRGIPYLADIKVYDASGNLVRDEMGLPITEKDFRWSPPSDLPTEEHSRALVFFDEMSAAVPSVQAATYQIILNRRIGDYHLPKNVAIVAAGNRVKDKGVAFNMPMPLANRFSHLTLEVSAEEWKEHATRARYHKDVVGYISFQGQDLNNFNPSNDGYAFATPRSWKFVSDLIQEVGPDGELVDARISTHVLSDLVKGTVGEAVGHKFMVYRTQVANLPSANDILTGKVTKLNTKQVDVMYALVVSLCYELQDAYNRAEATLKVKNDKPMEEFRQKVDTFFRFMMDNFEDELIVMGAKTVLGVYKLPIGAQKLTNWKEFVSKYADLLPGA